MGLLDTLLGRTKPVRPNLDALFALPSAAVTLESAEDVVSSGMAGVCWKPPAGKAPADAQAEISQLLSLTDKEEAADATGAADSGTADSGTADSGAAADGGSTEQGATAPAEGTTVTPIATPAAGDLTQAEDSFGYRWLLLEDKNIEDLVTRVHLVNSTLSDNGWGPQLLCSVFAMVPGPQADSDTKPFFLVYLYKRGTFYPFAPTGKEQRDSEFELHIRSVLGSDLPVEEDLSRWFPMWDLPVH